MAKRLRKRLLPMGIIMLIQMVVFAVTVFLAMGYSYTELRKASTVFDSTHERTNAALQEVQNALNNRIRLHLELLDVHHKVSAFQAEFDLLTLDPDRTDDKINQIREELSTDAERLQKYQNVIPVEELDVLLENIGIVLDIADELAITQGLNYRHQLYKDTVEPIQELERSIDQATQRFSAQNVALRARLLSRMATADTDLIEFKKHSSSLTRAFLLTVIILILIPGAMQLGFFRNLGSRLTMLETYADEIANENIHSPPFIARDKTGHLAIHLALMGRRIRRLLKISREESKRADAALKEVEQLAYYDPLTGLENRRLFNLHLSEAYELSKRYPESAVLFYIDLDNFKTINDSLGHDAGDELLKILAQRLTGTLRSSDHLARLGGDEFGIIAYHQLDNGLRLVERINEDLGQPMMVSNQEVQATVSIGIAIVESTCETASDLLRRADLAMYQAKTDGRNTYHYFSTELQDKLEYHLDMTRELRNAVSQQQFQLYYQPQIDLHDGSVNGAEALIRWLHPERGMIPPDLFISLAEETGLIMDIGEWVIHTACVDAVRVASHYEAMTIAVNISAKQFYGPSLVENIEQVLQATGLPAEQLEVEITEGILLNDMEHAIGILNQLREMGISISLDDFGTGFSSLNYLRQLPIDVLKIDRSFISNMLMHSKDRAIVKTIIELGRHMELKVIAEGIETREEAVFLRDNGCHIGQGFLFARPAPVESLLSPTEHSSNVFPLNLAERIFS
jgi:diguanylate cyclase (GGDEF)-like protein